MSSYRSIGPLASSGSAVPPTGGSSGMILCPICHHPAGGHWSHCGEYVPPPAPPDLAAEVADLRRRVEELERRVR